MGGQLDTGQAMKVEVEILNQSGTKMKNGGEIFQPHLGGGWGE